MKAATSGLGTERRRSREGDSERQEVALRSEEDALEQFGISELEERLEFDFCCPINVVIGCSPPDVRCFP